MWNISLYHDAVALLRQLIATPSFSREEAQTASMIAEFLEAHGVVVHRHLNNVWAVNRYFDASNQVFC